MSQKVVVDNAEIAYDLKVLDSVTKNGHLDHQMNSVQWAPEQS